jgi:hypothetical protein
MKIKWRIKKKRGNYRPYLYCEVMLEEWEKELAPGYVSVSLDVPDPGYGDCCMPGHKERHPDYQSGDKCQSLDINHYNQQYQVRLPWRPTPNGKGQDAYPEVTLAMERLRDAVENALIEAYNSHPINEERELGMTKDCKEKMCAYAAEKRILKNS